MATKRTGQFGSYYSSLYNDSEPLTMSEMEVNAQYIYSYLKHKGWSINAIAGMLGNMQAESTLNSGRWQNEDVGNTSMGYGLVQWTPATKYLEWCVYNDLEDPSQLDHNLARIIYEVDNGLQWISTSTYNLSFKEFSTSTKSVSYLAKAFLLNYERPADQSESVQEYRSSLAQNWFSILSTGSTQPSFTFKKRKKNYFLLFNANKRRSEQWIKTK